MNNIIEFENVSFSYKREITVFENISFEIYKGDYAAVVGPNGGGKTTLLKLMLGLLKPDSGRIEINGNPPLKAGKSIGYVPQYMKFDSSFPIKVKDVVMMGRMDRNILGFFTTKDRVAAERAMEMAEIHDLRNNLFSDLSGGQRQRVLIARALSGNPEILLLDEPTSNADPGVESHFHSLLASLKGNLTILTVSHDPGIVCSLVDKAVCVNKRVNIHPSCNLDNEMLMHLYGGDARIIDHSMNLNRSNEA